MSRLFHPSNFGIWRLRQGWGSDLQLIFEELCLRILDQTLAKASRPQQGTSWLGIKSICYLFYRK